MKCGFIGHRDSVGIEREIYVCISELMKKGVNEFYSGGMGNFDKMCERTVKKLNGKIIFVPYNTKQVKLIDKLWYDDIVYPFSNKEYSKYDIPNRNKWLVDNSDVLICHVYKNGGAKNTLIYAEKKNKKIFYIWCLFFMTELGAYLKSLRFLNKPFFKMLKTLDFVF